MSLLEVNGLVKTYGKRTVVNDVSFGVDNGEIVGLLGPNGAGKTTTFRMTIGMITPKAGQVFFNGHEVTKLPMYRRARMGMGYLSQESSVFQKLTVEENIEAILEGLSMSRKERKRRAEELLEELELTRLAKNRANTLSGGEKRRLEISRALVASPSLILLDEPFTGIDPIAVFDIQQIMVNLKKKGIGVLLTDHSVRETLSITDRSYIVNNGKVLTSGTSQELINSDVAKKFYLGETFSLAGALVAVSPTQEVQAAQPVAEQEEVEVEAATAPEGERALDDFIYFQESEFDKDFEKKLRSFDLAEIEKELERRAREREEYLSGRARSDSAPGTD
jgi:lipopolysaccharide export system ATP-binding protein